MAFQETKSAELGGPGSAGPFGLPVTWGSIDRLECPLCSDPLEEFAHVHRFTCYRCGFFISPVTVERIKKFIKFGEYRGPGISSGYGFGLKHFENETPF